MLGSMNYYLKYITTISNTITETRTNSTINICTIKYNTNIMWAPQMDASSLIYNIIIWNSNIQHYKYAMTLSMYNGTI